MGLLDRLRAWLGGSSDDAEDSEGEDVDDGAEESMRLDPENVTTVRSENDEDPVERLRELETDGEEDPVERLEEITADDETDPVERLRDLDENDGDERRP